MYICRSSQHLQEFWVLCVAIMMELFFVQFWQNSDQSIVRMEPFWIYEAIWLSDFPVRRMMTLRRHYLSCESMAWVNSMHSHSQHISITIVSLLDPWTSRYQTISEKKDKKSSLAKEKKHLKHLQEKTSEKSFVFWSRRFQMGFFLVGLRIISSVMRRTLSLFQIRRLYGGRL